MQLIRSKVREAADNFQSNRLASTQQPRKASMKSASDDSIRAIAAVAENCPRQPFPIGISKVSVIGMSEESTAANGETSSQQSGAIGVRPASSAADTLVKNEPLSPVSDKGDVYVEKDDDSGVPSPLVVAEPEKSPDESEHCNNRETSGIDNMDSYVSYYECEKTDLLDVECGPNKAFLYINKLCQGSKGKCIDFKGHMLTPNQFQSVSGRETAKDWKRSIRHQGKSLKTLMARGLIKAHPLLCECQGCKSGSRGLKSDRKITLSHSNNSKVILDDMATEKYTDYSGRNGNAKRARSASPEDDIYDMEQRKIFEMANSPEPKNIESLRKSLATDGSSAGSPTENISTSDINHNETIPSTTATSLVLSNNFTKTKPQGKNRKQLTPKHLQKVPHIALTTIPAVKSQAPNRLRFHQTSQSLTIPPGPLSAGELGQPIKRARSLFTPTSKSPSHVRMIELTRPAQSSTDKTATPPSLTNGDDHSNSFRQQSASSSTSDAVFLPSEMCSWSVDDVAEFVQSLKGCEEYSQVFREQAIDGEILPVLTEDHLLSHMGLKLGPALKIRLNVAKRLGFHLVETYND